MVPYLIVDVVGIVVFLGIGVLFSRDRKAIDFKAVGISTVFNILLAAFLILTPFGQIIIKGAADGFAWVVQKAYKGIAFAVPDFVPVSFGGNMNSNNMMFIISALMPMLLIIPIFDTLSYFKVLPFIIHWVGRGLAFITRRPKIESFFAVEMMFMGNTEALLASRFQLKNISNSRNLTVAMMGMSSISAAIVGSYITMVPGEFVIAAIPINIINAIIVTSLLNPLKVEADEDVVYQVEQGDVKKPPYFSFLGDSILAAGKMVFIITMMVVAFVALQNLIDGLLALTTLPWLSLENILGVMLWPFALLLGVDPAMAFELAQYMGTKLITNEFVVMAQVSPIVDTLPRHFSGVLTVFLTSFANISTSAMVLGTYKGIVGDKTSHFISKNFGYLLLSGIVVSLLSAGVAGLFIW
ncbi:MAG: nucleoside transporter [Candidatus Ancillula sp.]|jgi:CNT family concentrative nucleoside transporter/purine nucleoside transport protein|nr:nucleoside transporter [Candidatus Ancillula sp.]